MGVPAVHAAEGFTCTPLQWPRWLPHSHAWGPCDDFPTLLIQPNGLRPPYTSYHPASRAANPWMTQAGLPAGAGTCGGTLNKVSGWRCRWLPDGVQALLPAHWALGLARSCCKVVTSCL